MNKVILYLTIFAIIITAITGCSSPFEDTTELKVPTMPASLSGGTDASARIINRGIVPQDQWVSEYDQFIILPEIGSNYNGWLEDGIQENIDLARTEPTQLGSSWSEIENDVFTMEIEIDSIGSGATIRSNTDFTEIEMYVPYDNGETRYLRVKKTDDYTHSILLMYHTSGNDASDSVEIIETSEKKYLKCVRVHDISATPTLQHFVGITDLTTSDNKTTGRRRLETNRPAFTFSIAAGTAMDDDYTSQEEMTSGSYYEIYGFFNDNDNYVVTDTIDWETEGFTDPQDLYAMYAQGLDTETIGNLNIDGFAATGGIAIRIWDSTVLE